jgi:hypothetical protein
MAKQFVAGAVEAPDALGMAMKAAHEHVDACYARQNRTLIDLLSVKDWNDIPAHEPSLVADREGVDCSDGYDDCDELNTAA